MVLSAAASVSIYVAVYRSSRCACVCTCGCVRLCPRRCLLVFVCGFVDVITCGIVPCALFVFLRAVVLLGVLVFACASVRGSVRASVSARWCCQSLCPSALFGCVCVCVCVCVNALVCCFVFVCSSSSVSVSLFSSVAQPSCAARVCVL